MRRLVARRTWGSGEDLPTGERDLNARVSIIDGTGCVTGNLLADNVAGTGLVCSPASYTPIPLVVPVVGMFQAHVCVESDKYPETDGCLKGKIPTSEHGPGAVSVPT